MRETAAAYREEAKRIFKRIEDCSFLTEAGSQDLRGAQATKIARYAVRPPDGEPSSAA